MKQTSSLTRNLAASQEHAAYRNGQRNTAGVAYRLYLGLPPGDADLPPIAPIITRYFRGATLSESRGIWEGVVEDATAIDILATYGDLQKIVSLAGDLRHVYGQDAVLVTWAPTASLLVTA